MAKISSIAKIIEEERCSEKSESKRLELRAKIIKS